MTVSLAPRCIFPPECCLDINIPFIPPIGALLPPAEHAWILAYPGFSLQFVAHFHPAALIQAGICNFLQFTSHSNIHFLPYYRESAMSFQVMYKQLLCTLHY